MKYLFCYEVMKDMMQNFIIKGDVYTADIWKEHDIYLAKCPELNTTSQGKTIKTARLNLKEISRLFLEKNEIKVNEEE